jgi:hypothetical protein
VRTHHPDLADPSHVEAVLTDEAEQAAATAAAAGAGSSGGAVPGRHDPHA